MSRKKKSKSNAGAYKELLKEYDGLREDDEVVYTRLSDGKISLGLIKYFHLGEVVYASVIDLQLGNYQTAAVNEINRKPSEKLLQSLRLKAGIRSRRKSQSPRSSKRTKKT